MQHTWWILAAVLQRAVLLFEIHHTSPQQLLKEPVCLTVSVCLAQTVGFSVSGGGGGGGAQKILCYKKQWRGEIKAIYPNILLEAFECNRRWTLNQRAGRTKSFFIASHALSGEIWKKLCNKGISPLLWIVKLKCGRFKWGFKTTSVKNDISFGYIQRRRVWSAKPFGLNGRSKGDLFFPVSQKRH